MTDEFAALGSSQLVFSQADLKLLEAIKTSPESAAWKFHVDADALSIVPPGAPNGEPTFHIIPAGGGRYLLISASDGHATEASFPTLWAALEAIKPA